MAREECSLVIANFGKSEKIIQMAAVACTNHFIFARVQQMLLYAHVPLLQVDSHSVQMALGGATFTCITWYSLQ